MMVWDFLEDQGVPASMRRVDKNIDDAVDGLFGNTIVKTITIN